jgi:putative ABC transport system permease protein
MKRLLYFLLTITFLLVSFLSMKQFEFLQFQSFNQHNTNDEAWNVIIKEGDPQKDKDEKFQMLEEIALKSKVNLQRVSYEKSEKNEDKVVYYVYLYDEEKYFESIPLTEGNYLTKGSGPDAFLSTIQTGDRNQIGQMEIFHSFDPIEIRPLAAAKKARNLTGTYTIIGDQKAQEFKRIAGKYGLPVEISKEQTQGIFTEYPYQKMMYICALVLSLLIMLALVYDVINHFKAVAVRLLFGDNFFHVGVFLVRKYSKIFLSSFVSSILGFTFFLYFYNQLQQFVSFLSFWMENVLNMVLILTLLFIGTWIGTKYINISHMIKNKKPIKIVFYINIFVRLVLSVFLILGLQQGLSTIIELKSTNASQQKWSVLKDYTYMGVVANPGTEVFNFEQDSEKGRNFRALYKELESQGAFYISPSNYYLDDLSDPPLNPNPWGMEGKKVEINRNYLDVNPIKDTNGNPITIPSPTKSEIQVLVPEKFKTYQKDIEQSIEQDYQGVYNLIAPAPVEAKIIYVKNEQSYFTYSTQMASNHHYEIDDPIAVIVNADFDPMILANTVARGYGYYTKVQEHDDPFKGTQNTLKKYEFHDILQPVSVAYSTVELKMAKMTEEIQLTSIYSLLLLILAFVLLFFSSIYYLEINKQTLAIQWIFGYSFFEKHYLVYLSILVFWNVSLMISFFAAHTPSFITGIACSLACIDVVLMTIVIMIKERNAAKDVLIDQ